MLVSAATLSLLGLASASPLVGRQTTPNYPAKSTSKGFHLVVNVTDHSKDFAPSIQNTYISSIHVGAGLALMGQAADKDTGRIFYQNGTAEEHRFGHSNVLTDSGTQPFPSGIQLVKDANSKIVSTAHIDGGEGDHKIGLTSFPNPYSYLYPDTWVACNESLQYYQGKKFIIFKQADTTVGEDGSINYNIPEGCAPVNLLPECTPLNELPPSGSLSNHDYAIDSECYEDIKSLDWSQYGP